MPQPLGPVASRCPLAPAPAAAPRPCGRFRVELGELPRPTPPAAEVAVSTGAAPPAGPLSAPPAGSLPRALSRLLADERQLDRALAQAMSGRHFTPQELLVLQAKVIRYSQEVEVASRLVERLVGTVKQAMQTQV